MLARLSQTPLGPIARRAKRTAKAIVRALAPVHHAMPLPLGEVQAEVEILDPLHALEPDATVPVRVKLMNLTGRPWASAGTHPVQLAYRWETWFHEDFGEETRLPLPQVLEPGQEQIVTIPLRTPDHVGDFVLDVGLTQPGVGRFHEHGYDPYPGKRRLPVHLTGKRATDIDYHEVYRTADLQTNHWWVVGAFHSQEEYERSSRERLNMLIEHGLTPDSRVLDIGCGTGQMAQVLENYLSDRGAYYGTDIGKEAVEYCRRRFTRPGFAFFQNGMTKIPIPTSAGPFDMAIFFSVFTHTHADESVLLLAEVRRLLGPRGVVICDFFVSPLVEREAGHRGAMELNQEHFFRLIDALGFDIDILGTWQWSQYTRRLMTKLTRRAG